MANHTPPDDRITERLTVSEAAARLGITEGAVRGRINRGTLEAERDGGTVYVLFTDQTTGVYPGEYNALISQLRSEISYLREENQRKDHLLAAALERTPPQLEAPAGATDQDVTEAEETEAVEAAESPKAAGARERAGRVERWSSVVGLIAAFVGLLVAVATAAGGLVSSIVSAINGDQLVTIISAVIGSMGTVGATLIAIYFARRGRNR